MFEERFQGLKNDLLENTVDVRAHVNIIEGFDSTSRGVMTSAISVQFNIRDWCMLIIQNCLFTK